MTALAQGFSAPLVVVAAALGVAGALATWPGPWPGAPRQEAPGARPTDPAPGPSADPDRPREPDRRLRRADVEALLARGAFEEARAAAEAAGLTALADRARLLGVLARGASPGPLAQADAVVRVETTAGELVVGLVAKVGLEVAPDAAPQGADDRVVVTGVDGLERAFEPGAVRARATLRGADARAAVAEGFAAARRALGDAPSGLVLHRLAFQAFGAGLPDRGASLLVEALASREGAILVDMFGDGDLERLHRARASLPGATSPTGAPVGPLALAAPTTGGELPDRPDPPAPEPLEEPPDEPAEPAPTSSGGDPAGARDPVIAHPAWGAAENAYRTGLQLYRSAFGASVAQGGPTIRGALRQFRAAQDQLDRLVAAVPDAVEHYEVQRRIQEVNSLVLDCTKRLGTGD